VKEFPANRMRGIPGFGIDRMASLAERFDDVIRMENADTNLSPPAHVIAATIAALGQDQYNSYLPFAGLNELKEAIAYRYKIDDGIDYDPYSEILITSGATEAMLDVLMSLINPNDEVLLADPTYAGMIYRTKMMGGVPVFMPFSEENGWRLEVEKLPKIITSKSKLIFIMSPNMPTGAVYTDAELLAIAELADRHNLLILYNAALDKMLFNRARSLHLASLAGMRDRIIVIGSVSKNYNMIGWRVGWIAAHQKIIDVATKAHIYNAVTASGFAQAGAIAALTGPQDCIMNSVRIYQNRADVLTEGLNAIDGISVVKPKGGWFLIANVKKTNLDSSTLSKRLLYQGRVATTPMRDWGQNNAEGYIRFIFSNTHERDIRTAVKRVKDVYTQIHAEKSW
jgi:aspartate/methionine/tyrosine aminotransferase